MKKRYIYMLSALMICMNILPGFASQDFSNYKLSNIIDDDDNYVYIAAYKENDEDVTVLKAKKNLSSEFETVTGDPLEKLKKVYLDKERNDFYKDTDKAIIKNHKLYDKNNIEIFDVSNYEKENDDFYANNTHYEKKPISAYFYPLSDDGKFVKITVKTCSDASPMTPYRYNHYFMLKNGKYMAIDLPKNAYTNTNDIYLCADGSYFIKGYIKYFHGIGEYVIYHIAKNGKATNIVNLMPEAKNADDSTMFDVYLIGKINDTITFAFQSKDVNNSLDAVSFYDVDTTLNITKRTAENNGVSESYKTAIYTHYLSKDNQIFYLSSDSKAIVNASIYKMIRIDGKGLGSASNADIKPGTNFKKSTIKYSIDVDGNRLSIPVYEINGKYYFIAEDLEYYGYKLNWDNNSRISSLIYDGKNFKGTDKFIKDSGQIIKSDVQVLIAGNPVTSYNIGGYSLVSIDDDNIDFNFVKMPDKPVGTAMGNVLYSDIKTYFNGEPINGFNVDNHIAISIRDIRGKGYDVHYIDNIRHVEIFTQSLDDDSWAMPILAEDKSLKVGDIIGNILSTDITVAINDKDIPAYNYDGYMVIMAKDLSDYGFNVNYSDAAKEIKITTK